MRTTVELKDEQRAELLRLAAKRRLKGFSSLIQEAVDSYLAQQAGNDPVIEAALSLEGAFAGSEGEHFEKRVHSIRKSWR